MLHPHRFHMLRCIRIMAGMSPVARAHPHRPHGAGRFYHHATGRDARYPHYLPGACQGYFAVEKAGGVSSPIALVKLGAPVPQIRPPHRPDRAGGHPLHRRRTGVRALPPGQRQTGDDPGQPEKAGGIPAFRSVHAGAPLLEHIGSSFPVVLKSRVTVAF